jgi:hypothetical protein
MLCRITTFAAALLAADLLAAVARASETELDEAPLPASVRDLRGPLPLKLAVARLGAALPAPYPGERAR